MEVSRYPRLLRDGELVECGLLPFAKDGTKTLEFTTRPILVVMHSAKRIWLTTTKSCAELGRTAVKERAGGVFGEEGIQCRRY